MVTISNHDTPASDTESPLGPYLHMVTSTKIKHVVGFSGGIDSQATARWVLNRNDPANVILINSDVAATK